MAQWRINGGCCGLARQVVVACGQARCAGMAARHVSHNPSKTGAALTPDSARLDSGFRRAASDILDGLFPTPSTTCIHAGVSSTAGSRRGLPPRPLVPDAVYHLHPCRRTSL